MLCDVLRLRAAVHLFFPAILLGWRLCTLPPNEVWSDWVSLVVVYWAYMGVAQNSRAWPLVTTAVMGFLLGIYATGQLKLIFGLAG